jgi:catechol 2,3-dioxygenase-like lactoylglutathione lyase family enzyme
MPRLIGIGGVFLFAEDTQRLAEWYQRHLGFQLARMGAAGQPPTFYEELYYRDLAHPEHKLHTVFAIMPADGPLATPRNQAMINYRVDDLEALVAELAAAGIVCEPIQIAADAEGSGKFTHLSDPEGNRIELWEHISSPPADAAREPS